jgi:hypothetical protein
MNANPNTAINNPIFFIIRSSKLMNIATKVTTSSMNTGLMGQDNRKHLSPKTATRPVGLKAYLPVRF